MRAIDNFLFFSGATSAGVSKAYANDTCDVCALQVSGTFTSATVKVQGKSDLAHGEYTDLAVIDLSALSVKKAITAAGIYEAGIEGIQSVRVQVVSVSGGDITVFGKMTNSTGA